MVASILVPGQALFSGFPDFPKPNTTGEDSSAQPEWSTRGRGGGGETLTEGVAGVARHFGIR